ncbi:hypothetical protein PRIPAC_94584 [Pristionchus pacificus]|uniref:Uncharacterized protein n=1 Tax=Pristionchus pacificus TaxID=54126 RepID=A0A2A6CE57_PRIPA|nr:hypothetical protein PRIPAC_94584 [Pristionchus pacificus]|eukprot:PDM76396.1 hypothetical protein PRIPAC_40000 [Pristionchus pacificus]
MLLVSLVTLCYLSLGDALKCYVGEVPWGYNAAGSVESPEFFPNGIIVPVLRECPASTRCCSNMAYLVGQRYSCTDKCPIFNGRQEIFERFPTDGGINFCQKPEGSCKFQLQLS